MTDDGRDVWEVSAWISRIIMGYMYDAVGGRPFRQRDPSRWEATGQIQAVVINHDVHQIFLASICDRNDIAEHATSHTGSRMAIGRIPDCRTAARRETGDLLRNLNPGAGLALHGDIARARIGYWLAIRPKTADTVGWVVGHLAVHSDSVLKMGGAIYIAAKQRVSTNLRCVSGRLAGIEGATAEVQPRDIGVCRRNILEPCSAIVGNNHAIREC